MNGLRADLQVHRTSGFTLDIAFEADPGTTVALLGPNGAGKSTTVWTLSGVAPLTAGSITLGGRVLDDPEAGVFIPPEERRIGALFQDVLLFPHLDVVSNVAFAVKASSRRETEHHARAWLERLDLSNLANELPAALSGGQAQRVGLARALAGAPDLLLLDEPLSALDVGSRTRMRRMLIEYLDSFGGPRVLITHDPAEASLLADRVVVVEEGRVTQTGTPDEIMRSPRTPYAAELGGLNLLRGTARSGMVAVEGGPRLQVADSALQGDVLLTIHPRVVSIYPGRPEGSPRNSWPSMVVAVETLGDTCRVVFETPIPLVAEVTVQAQQSLDLTPGREAWVTIKATEIGVVPG